MKHTTFIALCMSLALPLFAEDTPAKDTPAKDTPAKEGAETATPKKPNLKEIFKKKDKDGDGFISKDEFGGKKAKDPSKAEAAFTKMDKDGDGKLSESEFTTRGKRKGK